MFGNPNCENCDELKTEIQNLEEEIKERDELINTLKMEKDNRKLQINKVLELLYQL